jgi:predicted RNA-binding protein associated with RNAse of E/G family
VLVVEDRSDQHMFCVMPGSRWMAPAVQRADTALALSSDAWTLEERVWTGNRILSFAWPGVAHAVLAFWDAATDRFAGWYVNLQDPLRRTLVGFDTMDHILDVVVAPDRTTWTWKDEDEFQEAQRAGIITSERAAAIRAEGERAVDRLVSREPPFDREWEDWRPDPSWRVPELPERWDVVER